MAVQLNLLDDGNNHMIRGMWGWVCTKLGTALPTNKIDFLEGESPEVGWLGPCLHTFSMPLGIRSYGIVTTFYFMCAAAP